MLKIMVPVTVERWPDFVAERVAAGPGALLRHRVGLNDVGRIVLECEALLERLAGVGDPEVLRFRLAPRIYDRSEVVFELRSKDGPDWYCPSCRRFVSELDVLQADRHVRHSCGCIVY